MIKEKRVIIKDQYTHKFYDVKYSPNLFGGPFDIDCFPTQRLTDSRENIRFQEAPSLSKMDDLIAKLKQFIAEKNAIALAKLLAEDFLISQKAAQHKQVFDNVSFFEEQFHDYTYAVFSARPNHEQLLLTKPEVFKELLEIATDSELKKVLLATFQQLQLDSKEYINFSGFDLTNVSFDGAALGATNFAGAIVNATTNFDGADLQLSNICYRDRQPLITRASRYWTPEMRKKMIDTFDELYNYAKDKLSPNDVKYKKIKELHERYQPLLKSGANIQHQVKIKMLTDLKQSETILATHRNLHYLMRELIVCVSLGIIGYVAAVAINYACTQRIGLFSQPKTDSKRQALSVLVENTIICGV